MAKRIIQPGQKFGAVVVQFFNTSEELWNCICECGTITLKSASTLLRSKITSCGCKQGLGRKYPDKLSLKRQVLSSYKTNASKKNISFDLTEDQFFKLILSKCYYCDSDLSSEVKTRKRNNRKAHPERIETYRYNGIDRVDNCKGYSIDNCVTCCIICNVSKNNLSLEEWKSWIFRVYTRTFNDYPLMGVESSDSK